VHNSVSACQNLFFLCVVEPLMSPETCRKLKAFVILAMLSVSEGHRVSSKILLSASQSDGSAFNASGGAEGIVSKFNPLHPPHTSLRGRKGDPLRSTAAGTRAPTLPSTESDPEAVLGSFGARAVAAAPLVSALPAHAADGGGFDPGVLLAIPVVGFGLYIAKFIVELLAEGGSQIPERLDNIGLTGGGPREAKKDAGALYDDTDYSYKSLSQRVENSRSRKKQSKQITADGKRFAPWMNIDEEMVEEIKAKKLAERKKKKATKKSNNFFGF